MASECGAYGTAMNSTTGSAKDASNAPHALNLWADGQKVATLGYEAMNDRWSLDYDAPWVALPEAFPLSPALPFEPPSSGYAAGAVKRFVENLLPEGRALDITATSFRVSKSNIYALISALGTETTGAFRFWRSDEVPPTVAAKPPAGSDPRRVGQTHRRARPDSARSLGRQGPRVQPGAMPSLWRTSRRFSWPTLRSDVGSTGISSSARPRDWPDWRWNMHRHRRWRKTTSTTENALSRANCVTTSSDRQSG